ncbi:MAG: YraN family protein [Chloroflexi bacterium]|nr:YraN family protein [Chloroflexota bacterium]
MTHPGQRLGRRGEELAARTLENQGLQILARNHRTRYGEIDLVARDGDYLVLVEVKTRSSCRLGFPEEALTPAKQARLVALAEAYVAETGWTGPWRIDVVAIFMAQGGQPPSVRWLPNAVGAP